MKLMIMNRVLVAATMVTFIAAASWAASPDQVGTWSGSVKIVTSTAGAKSVTKQDIQIEIAADDSTTITVAGVAQTNQLVAYNEKDAFYVYGVNSGGVGNAFIASLNFKGTTLKGTSVGISAAASVLTNTMEVKYKLKKQ